MIYKATKSFPSDEKFGLTNQLRRSAVSVPSNIAEGQSRNTTKDFKHFLFIARGSLAECHTQLIIAQELGYLPPEPFMKIENEMLQLQRMLNSLINKLPKN